MNELDDDKKSDTTDETKTPTNHSNTLVKFNLGADDINETEDEQDITLNETNNSNYENRPLINSYSQSMPQFPHFQNFHNPYMHHGATNANLTNYFTIPNQFDSFMYNEKENQRRPVFGMYNDLKLSQLSIHCLETFGFFVRYTLNLSPEVCKEILSNHKILHWLDRNKADGFVYHTLPKYENKQKMMPIRCELCKFYGHLSHNCTIREQSFKLYNVALKSGACRCHICGQLGHPAEAGLCIYISCSFCRKYGHWNHMCPNIDKVSRTLCHKCQRYGHTTERCPDQWRQFDRLSTLEQTPYKDPSETNKPVYCYQCAKQGHYGHNCPDFYRKYFIRDNHQLNPVYFFAGSSPFVKHSVCLTETDKKLIEHLSDRPIEDAFKPENPDQDPLEMLEKFQAQLRHEANLPPQAQNQILFNEISAQMYSNNIGFKKYIRRWSNWVIDFNWIYSLKFFLENLHESKMFYLIKNYPILDNFILHWMWWSYSLNKDMEIYTKDAFRGIGSMPWLVNDDINNNNKKKKNLNKKKKKKSKRKSKKIVFTQLNTNLFDSETFKSKYNKRTISLEDLLVEKESIKFEQTCYKFDEVCATLKHDSEVLNKNNFQFSNSKLKSKSIDFSELKDIYEDEDELEITIVYLDKDKTKSEVKTDETNETSVFDKFIKSFSTGQKETKENNFNKFVDILKSSNVKEQGLVITVSDFCESVPTLDSAPTVEQIETEIFGSKSNTDSSDLIKQLLKIDKNPIKIPNLNNPPIFEVLKNSVNGQNEQPGLLNRILTTPINVDVVNQLTSSSSSSGFSSSSISPQPLSSNPSPNSSNSSTAKPNIDSSFSTSCSSKSVDHVSSSSLSSSSSSVSIESNGNKQIEKLKEDSKETRVEEIIPKNPKYKPSGKITFNKSQFSKHQVNRLGGGGYQNRSFSKPNNNMNIKNQPYTHNFRFQQYQNRQFMNLQSKFPKSNSLPSNGKHSNPFSSNYMYSLQKSSHPMAQTSQSLHWQASNFMLEQNNQLQGYKNPKFRNQFNSSQNLRVNEKKDFREHGLMPLIPFQSMYTNSVGSSSSNSSTPSLSSNGSTPNSFNLQKSTNIIQQQQQQQQQNNFYKKPQNLTGSSSQLNQINSNTRQSSMNYASNKKNVKK